MESHSRQEGVGECHLDTANCKNTPELYFVFEQTASTSKFAQWCHALLTLDGDGRLGPTLPCALFWRYIFRSRCGFPKAMEHGAKFVCGNVFLQAPLSFLSGAQRHSNGGARVFLFADGSKCWGSITTGGQKQLCQSMSPY
jgi:hypothetical protein